MSSTIDPEPPSRDTTGPTDRDTSFGDEQPVFPDHGDLSGDEASAAGRPLSPVVPE